jgi:hypothetical protein
MGQVEAMTDQERKSIVELMDDYTSLLIADCYGGIPSGFNPDPVREARDAVLAAADEAVREANTEIERLRARIVVLEDAIKDAMGKHHARS